MTAVYYRILPERLREARLAAFLSQERLGRAAGVARDTVMDLEHGRGKHGCQGFTVMSLAGVLGVEPLWLLGRECVENTREAEGETRRELTSNTGDNGGETVDSLAGGRDVLDFDLGFDLGTTQPLEPRSSSKSLAQAVPERFAEFWAAYPRKVGKIAARTAFLSAAKKVGADVIIAGAERLRDDANLPDEFHIPHPTTWLHAGRWDDPPLAPHGLPPPALGLLDTIVLANRREMQRNGQGTGEGYRRPASREFPALPSPGDDDRDVV